MLLALLTLALDPVDDARAMLEKLIPMATVSATETPKTSTHYNAMRAWLEEVAKKEGFAMRTSGDNAVFELAWGEGDPILSFVVHGDVVPAPRGEWTVDPFVLTEKDGKLYGRGSEDDKGPLAAVLAVMKAKKAAGFRPKGKVLLIIGMGEEYDWDGIKAYVAALPKMPTHNISVDSGYPVTANEFGFVGWTLSFAAGTAKGTLEAVDLQGGEFLTQVPGTATLLVRGRDAEKEVAKAIAATKRPEFNIKNEKDGEDVKITVTGVAVHTSEAPIGKNALWGLSAVAAKLPLNASPNTTALRAIARYFDGDHFGKKLGVGYEDKDMGKLLAIPSLLRQAALGINMRRPKGKSNAEFVASLEATRARLQKELGAEVKVVGETYVGDPHVAQVSATVPVLLEIYDKTMGTKGAKAATIRGGTYARLFPGGVNFGPSFPDEPYMGHAPDEYITKTALAKMITMLSEALVRLASAAAGAKEQ